MPAGPLRKRWGRIWLWAAPLAWLGCGGGTDIVLPSLTITTSTHGVELDSDGYSVAVDGSSPQAIGLDATATVDGLPDGQHTVELSGVAANCSAADNPRAVTVSAGGTTTAAFSITCGPSAGSVAVTTTTSGAGSDPDGFTLTIDGVDGGAIGVTATSSLTGLTPGVHAVGLTGLAANCVVAGDNPRSVTVASGQAATIGFTVSCAAPPPGSGSLVITAATSGTSLDPDGYTLSLDSRNPQSIAINGSLTISGIAPGPHSVQLSGEAANCTVSGERSRPVTVSTGQTATVQFSITCVAPPPGTGIVQITAATSGSSLDPDGYTVRIDQSSFQSPTSNGTLITRTVTAGSHTVQLGGVAGNCTVGGENPRTVTVTAGQTTVVPFAITCVTTAPSVNLRISNLYVTQSTQTLDGSIPLVAGRAAYLRVFVVANQATGSKPAVEVTLRNGATTIKRTINAPSGATPTRVQEGTLGSSWNLPIEASLIQPGLSILATVDPQNAIPETQENDNTYPTSGSPVPLTVRTVPAARIRFVSIQQGSRPAGNVSSANKDKLTELARRIYPLNGIDADVRSTVFAFGGTLGADGSGWGQLVTDLDGLRTVEGTDRTYYGLVNVSYSRLDGLVGLTLGQGVPTAIGWDNPADAARVVAHELGHTWNQLHTPCGQPPNINFDYPYGTGIGVYGFDVVASSVKATSTPDIMGYCDNPWVSDYIYKRVMDYREANVALAKAELTIKQPAILVWGRIVNGQPVLEPAFRIVTRPSLPPKPGPYTVEGIAADGTRLFSISFDAVDVVDDPLGSRHFAFAVPLDQARAARLADLRLTGPGGMASAASLSTARVRTGAVPDSVVARREADGVALQWNASSHPMIMVRDPDTGEVLSFARGGKARVWTMKATLDVVASDGVQSKAKRVTVTR